jgi:hypothetical protein
MADKVKTIEHPILGVRRLWVKSLTALEVNGECLSVDIEERNKVSGIASRLKCKGMEFISKKDNDQVLYGRIK